ncbi:FAD-binding oxidoreductase [Glycomyces buryatensis]|uniref:FAD-binding protein n=1 Tax=Glycomyces buryatensis TaxID=2570927 RepID=A0A4S8QIU3_9ACTN|nr:FAD-linked oxidase C-terminal domain-containing protein [Glycomyces buryatensis]THV40654.1 FAD-binding protein [Glycomyces buryatensis]
MSDLFSALATAGVEPVVDADVIAAHSVDQARLVEPGRAAALVRAADAATVSAVLGVASEYGTPVVTQGARTGLAGSATAVDGAILLDVSPMNQIVSIDPVNRIAVCEPGVLNADISRAAAEHGLRYSPDPGSWQISTIGGNIATAAGGMCCVKYGVTAEYVLGLEVVLASGEVMRCGRQTAKGVAGYDLTRLMCGSEGTLGVITEATLKLSPIPAERLTLAAVFDTTAAAGNAVTAIMAAGCQPSLLELIDNVHLRALEALRPQGLPTDAAALLLVCADSNPVAELTEIERLCTESGAAEVFRATDETEADALLESRRNAYHAMERLGTVLVDDVAVPRSRLAEALDGVAAAAERHGVVIGVIAHAGDGNLHPNIVVHPEDESSVAAGRAAFDEILEMALAMGGTITGEHGVGMLKRDWLAREMDPVNLAVQRRIKHAFDPLGILNPGKVLAV